MADSTIANLTDGTTAEDTDRLPVERSPFGVGQNRYITPAYIRTNIHGTYGTGVATALGVNVGSAGAFVTFNGALGTPSSGTLTNATGLPLTTGVTGDLPLSNLAQASAASRLLGRGSASGAGDFQEITLGSGLSMSGTTLSSSGGASTPTFPGGIPLTGVSYPECFAANCTTGNTDTNYIVPTGKRALILSLSVYNPSGGTIQYYATTKISSAYYRISGTLTRATLTGQKTVAIGYIAEAGETIAINTATTNGLNAWFQVVEFDDSCGVFSAKLTTVSAGDNTVYTVPASTKAVILDSTLNINASAAGGAFFSNASGGSRTVYWHVVQSGGSPGSTNQITASTSVADNGVTAFAIGASMGAGDFVNVNTAAATATQMPWVNIMEIVP